jgi:hypothetical protein
MDYRYLLSFVGVDYGHHVIIKGNGTITHNPIVPVKVVNEFWNKYKKTILDETKDPDNMPKKYTATGYRCIQFKCYLSEGNEAIEMTKARLAKLLKELPAQTYDVELIRTSHSKLTIPVTANSLEEAKALALRDAGDYEYSEYNAEYSAH